MSSPITTAVTRSRLPVRATGDYVGVPVVMVGGMLAGAGWLYLLRGLGWLGFGPRIGAALLLLFAAQAAYALTRNLHLTDVLFSHSPGVGPVLEALLLAAGCSLPRALTGGQRRGARRG